MTRIINSLTSLLDKKLKTLDEVDDFLNNLEDEVLGYKNIEFYLRFKGDIKEFTDKYADCSDHWGFESELLKALINYAKERAKYSP